MGSGGSAAKSSSCTCVLEEIGSTAHGAHACHSTVRKRERYEVKNGFRDSHLGSDRNVGFTVGAEQRRAV